MAETASTAPEIGGSTKGCVPTNVGCYKEEVTKSKIEVNDIDDRDKGYAAGLPCFTLCARDRACAIGCRRAHAPADPLRARHRPLVRSQIAPPSSRSTPDEWVPRHPSLVRLTGRHPFNCEPPLKDLMGAGFITPSSLHYVRNHGAVPKCEWATHTLTVDGLVDKPTTFTMDDLLAMPAREIPITLVCAGNRRKEENLTAQTIGFNWGAAGHGCSVWKGVLLRDVLLKCGVKTPKQGAHHVCFVGKESMPKGRYGTSIVWHTAMDPACDVMLAYEQNGEKLMPDHGYPLRLVIPGFIGGRMIKWLTEISVTEKESDNYFHFNDNRVLPEHVTAEIATAEGWWYKPDYIINDLNINSAVSSPDHEEVLALTGKGQTYAIKGYAYNGGGRKVIRVEVSIDGGKTWTLSTLTHPEKPTKYGKYWAWCFFEQEVSVAEMWKNKDAEILCRGWDCAMQRQPEKLVWNVMGMMNNSYFRVKVHRTIDDATGLPALKFQHPTLAGPGNFGGWFEEQVLGPKDALKPKLKAAVSAAAVGAGKSEKKLEKYTWAEIEKHTEESDLWFVVNGKVYNGTAYLEDHPGGASSIIIVGGSDCSDEFAALHSSKAWAKLEEFVIGTVAEGGDAAPTGDAAGSKADDGPPKALNPKSWVTLPLASKTVISHDTRVFRFSLPSEKHVLGLPVGQHFFVKATVNGKAVIRAYTPVRDGEGWVDLLIKVYFANVHPRFPAGGLLTQHIDGLAIGDTIEVKGPIGHYSFPPQITGEPLCFNHVDKKKMQTFAKVGLIAGGSGITPVMQVATALLKDPATKVEVHILYANQTPTDILMADELNAFEKDPRAHVWYTVDRPGGNPDHPLNADDWKYSTGFINEAMVKEHLPAPADDVCTFMCGPPMMLEKACIPNLKRVGHEEFNIFAF